MKPARLRAEAGERLFVALVLTLGSLLLLVRLDDAYLWQDEAETALVARNLLRYGLPLSSDGVNWVQQAPAPFVEFTEDYVWVYHSWLQYVLVAGSLAVLGDTTLAARLPFALVALATLLAFYRFAVESLGDRKAARAATVLLVLCVPFLLHMRQSRYYALAALSTVLTLHAYLRLRAGSRHALPGLILSAFLLYHSHYGAFFPMMLALAVHWVWTDRSLRQWPQIAGAGAGTVLLVGPWAVFMRVLERGQAFRLDRFVAHLGQYLLYTTGWILPWALVLVLAARWARGRTALILGGGFRGRTACELIALVVGAHFLILSFSAAFEWVFFRYMVHLVPLLLCLVAVAVVYFGRRSRILAYGLMLLLVSSNALGIWPYALPGFRALDLSALWPGSLAFASLQEVYEQAGRFRSELWMYAQELTHPYTGPNEGIVGYLSLASLPGQTVAVNYEELPLMFYTGLRVVGGLGLHGLSPESRPDWVIDRRNGPYRDLLAAIVANGSYERIEIPYPDIRWENRPGPGTHHFLTVQDAPSVVVYKRVRG